MMSDFWIVLQWWGTLFLVGAVAWPLTKTLFGLDPRLRGDDRMGWWDEGYLFSKAVGMAAVTWIVYALGTIRVMPFSIWSIGVAMGAVFFLGIFFHKGNRGNKGNWGRIIIEEVFFLAALLLWSWVKAHEPNIRGLEKFMDYGFMQSILNTKFFPPQDMWYTGLPINYYYFGHMVTAVLTRLSGLDLAYTFNLMLATIFALTLTMSFSIGYQISQIGQIRQIGRIAAGTLTAFLVTLAGNMQTIYAFTRGYTGENVKPFWELGWKLTEGFNTYWYANATRFIPFTIHEFPGYSFVVSDVHGHVLSIPFVLLAIGMLIQLSAISYQQSARLKAESWKLKAIFYGFLMGVLLMTNALDGPIYFGLFALLLFMTNRPNWSNGLYVLAAAILTSLPFLSHFKSFVTGLAVNCPPAFLANTKIGPIMFEGVEKCQISPLWMWWLLWGFFIFCGGWLIFSNFKLKTFNFKLSQIIQLNTEIPQLEKLLLIFFIFALGLVIFPEFFYFKDIYPAHFRSNTMFKLGYDAFILFSIISGYTIVKLFHKKLFFILLIPQLILVSIFPIFAVRSYFGGLKNYEGMYGLNWLAKEYSDDWRAIEWLQNQTENGKRKTANRKEGHIFSLPFTFYRLPSDRFAIVEADGDSYTDYGRFSAFTGIPTIIGWSVHEWLWRGSYDVVAPRREEVRLVYESADAQVTRAILRKYAVRYIIVGKLEREKYKSVNEGAFGLLGKELFRSGKTVIYETY